MTSSLPAKAIDLIPHRAGMKLIDALTHFSEDDASAVLEIQESNLFINKSQRLDSIVFIELLAQTAAAHSGYKAKFGSGAAKFGFLVGVKDLKIMKIAEVSQQLTLKIHRDFQIENVTFLDGKVLRGKEILAEGVLKLWEMPAADMEVAPTQIPASPDNPVSFQRFNKQQMALIEASFLNQKIIQHCNGFRSVPESGTIEADFYYQKDFIGFEGHFPGNPIVPGVLMLKTGLLLAELANGSAYSLKNIRTAKFAKTVLPNEVVQYSLSINENKIKIQVKSQDALCAKFALEIM